MYRIEKSKHRLRRSALCATFLLAFAMFASAAQAQRGVRKVNRLTFSLTGNAGAISQNATRMTTELPRDRQINARYAGRHLNMRLAFASSGRGTPQARFVQAAASHYRVRCSTPSSTRPVRSTFSCSADATWLRSLSRPTTIKIELGGAGVQGKLTAYWVINPN